MVTQVVFTLLMLAVFMIAFTYFLNTLFFRKIEKKERDDKKNAKNHNDSKRS
ncbi:hypothetical protein [Lactiplantibacillus modestisalitolerans]|uniref:Uncharacterized protein n=1 Tax=Lactiplantibacillus modestisalitolerans TaxID=1457219 RepID=A0ABV5WS12_9LACO|nr:hypothetical protein [Lactiplantibacillus modestisalitolerans]